MNEKRILDAIGNADEKYILEAAPDISVFFNSNESIERGIDMDNKKIRFLGKKLSLPIAVAIAAAALAITVGAVIFEIAFIANSSLGEKQEIISELKNDVFSDENENIRLTVQEFITDGSNSIMTIRYDYLTEEGKAWGDENLNLEEYDCHDKFIIEPSINPDGSYASPGAVWFYAELEKYNTPTSRYFAIAVELDSVFSENNSLNIKYTIGEEPKNAIISTENKINRKWYALKSDEQLSEYVTPKILCVSDLNCAVYGENNGYSEHGRTRGGGYWGKTLVSSEVRRDLWNAVCNVSLVTENGKTDIAPLMGLGSLNTDIEGCDMEILSAQITYLDSVNDEIITNKIDLDSLKEIEIDGVVYFLEEIESPVNN
ncbi:MAG: hypothetical protein ACI4JK_05205 [Oscillospiraceae bacterium]